MNSSNGLPNIENYWTNITRFGKTMFGHLIKKLMFHFTKKGTIFKFYILAKKKKKESFTNNLKIHKKE